MYVTMGISLRSLALRSNYLTGSLHALSHLPVLRWFCLSLTLPVDCGIHVRADWCHNNEGVVGFERISSIHKFDSKTVQFSPVKETNHWRPHVFRIVDLSYNRLSSPMHINLPSVSFLELRNNSLREAVLSSVHLTSPAFVDINSNIFLCPYPNIGRGIGIEREACIIDWLAAGT